MKKKYQAPLIATIIFSQLGSSILAFIISLKILKETESATAFGIVIAISSITTIIATPFLGVLVDKYSKRKSLFLSQTISILALSIFSIFLKLGGSVSILSVSILNVFLHLSDSLYSAALLSSAVYIVSDEEELNTFNSIDQSVSSLCSLIGPLLAGALFNALSVQTFILLEILCELLALVTVWFIPMNEKPIHQVIEETAGEEKGSLISSFKYIRKQKIFVFLSFGMLISNFLMASITVGLPFILSSYFADNTLIIGLVQVALPIGLIIASIVYSGIHYKGAFYKPIFLGWTGLAVILIFLGFSVYSMKENFYLFSTVLTLAIVLMGCFVSVSQIPLLSYSQQAIPAEKQGRVFSMLDSLVQVTLPFGTVVYGLLFDHLSIEIIFVISGFMLFVFVMSVFFANRNLLHQTAIKEEVIEEVTD